MDNNLRITNCGNGAATDRNGYLNYVRCVLVERVLLCPGLNFGETERFTFAARLNSPRQACSCIVPASN